MLASAREGVHSLPASPESLLFRSVIRGAARGLGKPRCRHKTESQPEERPPFFQRSYEARWNQLPPRLLCPQSTPGQSPSPTKPPLPSSEQPVDPLHHRPAAVVFQSCVPCAN